LAGADHAPAGSTCCAGDGGLVLVEDAAGQWSADGVSATALEDREAASVLWEDVVRVFEWFDACEHSLERRRTIELHSEPASERTVFKTQMTAIGCGLLMATLLLALVYLAVGAAIGDPKEAPQWVLMAFGVLRLLVFAPLALFLIAQLLLPLTRTPRKANDVGKLPGATPPGRETGG
jgi:hypothetical protein